MTTYQQISIGMMIPLTICLILLVAVACWMIKTKYDIHSKERPNRRIRKSVGGNYIPEYRTGLFWKRFNLTDDTFAIHLSYDDAVATCNDAKLQVQPYKTQYFRVNK